MARLCEGNIRFIVDVRSKQLISVVCRGKNFSFGEMIQNIRRELSEITGLHIW